MSAPVAFIDTETLGLDADLQPIWEIAIIRGCEEIVQQVQVTPRQIELAHPKALEISGFEERYHVDRAIHPAEAAKRVSRWLSGCHLVSAVVSFDEERLRRLCWKFHQPVTWHYHIVDVEALAVGYLAGTAMTRATDAYEDLFDIARPPWDSTELSKAVGVDPTDPAFTPKHTALTDARWAKAIYLAVMGGDAA